jgi:mono/diheme cytochrome c family protein
MKIIPFAFLMALAAAPALAQAPSRGDDAMAGTADNRSVHGVTGQQVFTQVCQACHMADGKGGSGAATVPALARNPHLADPGYPITMVVQGRGAMPFLTDILSPTQIANVVGYVRTHFGNNYPGPVTSADVERVEGHGK